MHEVLLLFSIILFSKLNLLHKLLILLKFIGSTNKELPARSRLDQLCSAIGWKCPTYDFEDQGFYHTKL
jgi:hypothetical protein